MTWQPSASIDALNARAKMNRLIRAFFESRGVLEVETPLLCRTTATDPHLNSFTVPAGGQERYLQTSPEFCMKRLLAAGSGPIYQLCKAFRFEEQGRLHNPEFTLLEWYRTGFDHLDLMDDVERLLRHVLEDIPLLASVQHWIWRDLFREFAAIDPFAADVAELQALLQRQGIETVGLQDADRDAWLDLVMTQLIEPRLGAGLVFVRDYPASQAALARVRPGNPPLASRFEVYLNGIELANGFHELADAAEQGRRFEAENAARARAGLPVLPVDRALLAALESGLPDCAGVALGLDRLLLLTCGAGHIDEVLTFPFATA